MVSNRPVCVNHQDNFCYICVQYTHKQQCRSITKSIQLAYKYYFDNKLGDQDNEWPPHVCRALAMYVVPVPLQLNAISLNEW